MGTVQIEDSPFPSHLHHFEDLIGLAYFSDPRLEHLAHTDPGQIDPELLGFRHELYLSMARAVIGFAGGALAEGELPSTAVIAGAWPAVGANRPTFLAKHAELIRGVRGELMEGDVGLKSSSVRRLEASLGSTTGTGSKTTK